MKNKLVRAMAAGFAAVTLLSGCGGNGGTETGAAEVTENTEVQPTEEPVVETASDKGAVTDTDKTEPTMAPEEEPTEAPEEPAYVPDTSIEAIQQVC